jgi:hypothetical protein
MLVVRKTIVFLFTFLGDKSPQHLLMQPKSKNQEVGLRTSLTSELQAQRISSTGEGKAAQLGYIALSFYDRSHRAKKLDQW